MPLKPSFKNVAAIVGLQLGISILGGLVFEIIDHFVKSGGSGSWVGMVGLVLGSQVYGQRLGKKQEEPFPKSFTRRLSLYAATAQVGIGVLFGVVSFFVLLSLAEIKMADVFQDLSREGLWGVMGLLGLAVAGILLIGLISYAATLWSFQAGVKRAQAKKFLTTNKNSGESIQP